MMTRTQIVNLIYAIVCAVVALGGETGLLQIFPDSWKHYVTLVFMAAMWLKMHKNLWINPDGSPATVAYDAEARK